MKNADLRVHAVAYLKRKAAEIKHGSHELTYSAKHISSEVGGYAGALGQIADEVAGDLRAMGIDCTYFRNRKPTVFVLVVKDA